MGGRADEPGQQGSKAEAEWKPVPEVTLLTLRELPLLRSTGRVCEGGGRGVRGPRSHAVGNPGWRRCPYTSRGRSYSMSPVPHASYV